MSTDPIVRRGAFDVVALAASAGGIEAVTAVLRTLPEDFPAAAVILMHLAEGTETLHVFGKHSALPVVWAVHGGTIVPGRVYVCPGKRVIELEPDGTCSIIPRANPQYPIDATLASVAESYRERALAVVLTGMRDDGAKGVAAIKRHGGTVLVQSEDTAEHPAMPRAAIATGVVDLVLPLSDIGRTVVAAASSGTLPPPRVRAAALDAVFGGPGEMRALYRSLDWSQSVLGPIEHWSPEITTVLRVLLSSPLPMVFLWGPELVQFTNDASKKMLGESRALKSGQPFRFVYPELWEDVRADIEHIVRTRVSQPEENAAFYYDDGERLAEHYYTFTRIPVITPNGVEGVIQPFIETTTRYLAERRMASLAALASVSRARMVNDAFAAMLAALEDNPYDLPFALAYEIDEKRKQARLKGALRVAQGSALAPSIIDLRSPRAAWPLASVVESKRTLVVSDLTTRFFERVQNPWDEPVTEAMLLPLTGINDQPAFGVLVLGLNRRRPLDELYRAFLELVASQIGAAVVEAQAFTTARKREEALAEANRAKTEFFSNVSHEFRTPLTLILGPLERTLAQRTRLPRDIGHDLEVAARNARRLLTLVTSLLDFTLAETHRMHPRLESCDLAAETRSIAALFRSAIEHAGLSFMVDCAPLSTAVQVDREMWGKILVNLLSNALKFTLEGEICVVLRERSQHAELVVSDTGLGISAEDQMHIFERYFRGSETRARTQEGSGIGLSLTRELVRLHGGRVRVESKPDAGTTITVWIPMASRTPRPSAAADSGSASEQLQPTLHTLAEAALAWTRPATVPEGVLEEAQPLAGLDAIGHRTSGARVLVADDNADMRAYLERLLSEMGWLVESVSDGDAAFERAKQKPPDLIVADVMMPRSDGVQLLRRVRTDSALSQLPLVLVTARAGESAAVEGLMAGANDYIAKPFSARELVARVGAQLELARVRRRAEELNAFLVRFSDRVRGLTDSREVARIACGMLGEQLRCESVLWAELDRVTCACVIEASFVTADTRAALVEPRVFGEGLMVVDDAESDFVISEAARARLLASHISATIRVPVLVGGALRALLCVSQSAPRRWTPEDIALVEGVAGRSWSEVERARAEHTLREIEQRMRLAIQATHMVTWDGSPRSIRSPRATTSPICTGCRALRVSQMASHSSERRQDSASCQGEKIAADGGTYLSEFRIRRLRDGRVLWLEGAPKRRSTRKGR